MNLKTVIQELIRLENEFNINTYESGDMFGSEKWAFRETVIHEAIEYLSQYLDQMD